MPQGRKKAIVANAPQDVTTGETSTDFGANDWLIEDMREQYLADPESLDPVWVSYFEQNGAPNSTALSLIHI